MEHTVLTVFLHFEWSDELALGGKKKKGKKQIGCRVIAQKHVFHILHFLCTFMQSPGTLYIP